MENLAKYTVNVERDETITMKANSLVLNTIIIISDGSVMMNDFLSQLHNSFFPLQIIYLTSVVDAVTISARLPSPPIFIVDETHATKYLSTSFKFLADTHPDTFMIILTKTQSNKTLERLALDNQHVFITEAIEPGILQRWFTMHSTEANNCPTSDVNKFISKKFSERKRQVMLLLIRGLTNKEIAKYLNLAEVTIKIHISEIFRKLGVENRTEAALRIGQHSLLY